MDLNCLTNINGLLVSLGKMEKIPAEAKADIDTATNFFGNIISDINKELAKPQAKEDKAKERLYIYPLRVNF